MRLKEEVQLRVTGKLENVERWVQIIKKNPRMDVIFQSKPYKNRGSRKIRIYVTIAYTSE